MAADPGITAAIIAGFVTVIGGIFSHHQIQKREIKARHFIEKKNAYMHFINLVFDVIKAIKNKSTIPMDKLEKVMLVFKRELIVWADQDVLQAYRKYEEGSSNNSEPEDTLLIIEDLLRAIRKDLGHDDSQLNRGDLIGMLIVAEDRKKLLTTNA